MGRTSGGARSEERREENTRRVMGTGMGLTADTLCGLGAPVLVPLTTSLYVPGKLASTETVIVDVGTGFYVEKVRLPLALVVLCLRHEREPAP